MIETLDEVRADAFARLAKAVADRRSAFHTPVVATSDAGARVMVLRGFDEDDWTLRFHTDWRSPKVGVIAADGRIGVAAYDKHERLQLRLRGTGRVLREGHQVDVAWNESTNFARRCYLGEGPGSFADAPSSGLPERFEGEEPSDAELVPARENFAILLVDIAEIDWFCLAHTGHRRALITRGGGHWITP